MDTHDIFKRYYFSRFHQNKPVKIPICAGLVNSTCNLIIMFEIFLICLWYLNFCCTYRSDTYNALLETHTGKFSNKFLVVTLAFRFWLHKLVCRHCLINISIIIKVFNELHFLIKFSAPSFNWKYCQLYCRALIFWETWCFLTWKHTK